MGRKGVDIYFYEYRIKISSSPRREKEYVCMAVRRSIIYLISEEV